MVRITRINKYKPRNVRRASPEADEQIAFIKHIDSYFPTIKDYVWHTPNGGNRGIREAFRLKLMGVRRGVPDIFIAYPSFKYHGMFIEFKSTKGRVTSDQTKMLHLLGEAGYLSMVCRTWQEAIQYLIWYLEGTE